MRRTELLQEVWKMRFEEACGGWQERRLTQEFVANTHVVVLQCYPTSV